MKKTLLAIILIATSVPSIVLSLQKQIENYEQRLSSPSISEKAKSQIRAEIQKLKAQLEAQRGKEAPVRAEEPKREETRRVIERLVDEVQELLNQVKNADPEIAERLVEALQ